MSHYTEMDIPAPEDVFPGLNVGGPDEDWDLAALEDHNAVNAQFTLADRGVVDRVMNRHALPTDRILEIGCGLGRLGLLMPARYFRQYTQSELSVPASRQARRSNTLPTVAANALALPFADASFNIVAGLDTLDMITDTGALTAEISRVLKPGGRFIHFHDRRPNLAWLASHVGLEDRYIYPYVDKNGVLSAFQLIERGAFHELYPQPAPQLAILANPRSVEVIRSGRLSLIPGGIVDVVSTRLERTGRTIVTASFNELMAQIANRAFAGAGLSTEMAGTITAQVELPRSETGSYSVSVCRGEHGHFEYTPTQDTPVATATQHIIVASKN